MDSQLLTDWLQLINTDGVGPRTFEQYLQKFSSAANALAYLAKSKKIFTKTQAEDEIYAAEKFGAVIITKQDNLYPENLRHIADAPPVLYLKGRTDLLSYPAILGIVGSRNASVTGRKIASKIAYDLTNAEVLVASGLARGIDSAAHKGAMYAKDQKGPTIAVLGTGLDVCYPKENEDLYEQIMQTGLLVSEYPFHTEPLTQNFPRRNRIISGISAGVLVVEAGLNSGSLITAKTALEQGKDIFAVPGSPIDERSAGANKLIKDGAYLTESAEDVLQILKITQNRQLKTFCQADLFSKSLDKQKKSDNIPQETEKFSGSVLSLIGAEGIEQDALIRASKRSPVEVMTELTELELEGIIKRQNGSYIVLTNTRKHK